MFVLSAVVSFTGTAGPSFARLLPAIYAVATNLQVRVRGQHCPQRHCATLSCLLPLSLSASPPQLPRSAPAQCTNHAHLGLPPCHPPIGLPSTHVRPRPFLDSGRLFRQHLELLGPLQDYDLPADPDGSASEDVQNRARCHIRTGTGRTRVTSAPGLPGPSYALFLPRCCALHFDGRTRQQQQRVHRRRRRRRRPWLGACMRRRRRQRQRRRGRLV